ncbi:MAG TPA: glycoside hydrolase family 3 N-terminal domain-containing protein [Rectinemataceae bacterium]|nr:glycoside hydrolase family 3 N-terminal domain-containing protein [Rectinemataceae bacterium]
MSRRPSPILLALLLLALVVTGMSLAPGSALEETRQLEASTLLGPVLASRIARDPGSAELASAAFEVSASGKGAGGAALVAQASMQGVGAKAQPAPTATARPGSSALDFWSRGDPGQLASSLVASMSPEEVIGQVFLLGYPGTVPPPLIYEWIKKRGIGGVKIFGWNTEDTAKLAAAITDLQTAALSSAHRIPLLIATDQEGGIVRHVKGSSSETPGNMAIGASGRPSDAYWSGFYIARELDALGINMNFAPAVDLATSPKSQLIGTRSFSDDPLLAGILGASFSAGTMAAGIIPTAKHFPGHGGTDLDSHGVTPHIYIDRATLEKRELVPFKMLVEEGLPAVMSGHLSFPRIDPSERPASLSRTFMIDILRGELGFKGVAVTDDLRMGGTGTDYASACREALDAGDDLLMSSILPDFEDSSFTGLLAAYRSEPAFRARLREAATRIIRLKLDWLAPRGQSALIPLPGQLSRRLPDRKGSAFFRDQADRAATALFPASLPWHPTGRLLVASPLSTFSSAAAAVWPKAATFRFSWRPESKALPDELAAFDASLVGVDSVLVCVQGDAGMDFVLKALARGKKVSVVSILSPYPLARAPAGLPAVAVYSMSPESIDAALSALRGLTKAEGNFPFELVAGR